MKLEDQKLLFSIFHDGSIIGVTKSDLGIQFFVDIMYLAERIKPNFESLSIRLINPTEFYFENSETNIIIYDLEELCKLELEILKTDTDNDSIKVFCSVNRGKSFGYLIIKTEEIQVFDPENNIIKLNYLEAICSEYWEAFGNND